jgi:hypothetical protein
MLLKGLFEKRMKKLLLQGRQTVKQSSIVSITVRFGQNRDVSDVKWIRSFESQNLKWATATSNGVSY